VKHHGTPADHHQNNEISRIIKDLRNYFPEKFKNCGKNSAIFIKSEEKIPRFKKFV